MRGHPTSPSSEGATDKDRADTARGTLRDGLGGLRNLVQLLHSLRVAPKSIVLVLPDVHAALSPMREAKRELIDGLRRSLPNDAAARELEDYIDPRFQELDVAINEAMRQTMSARVRLRLEQTTTRLSRELDAARDLLDLLTEARVGRRPALDLLEVIKQGCAPSSTLNPAERTRSAVLTSDVGPFEAAVNARVLMGLLSLGVELLSVADDARPQIHVQASEPLRYTVVISAGRTVSDGAEELSLAVTDLIAPTQAAFKAAAELSGAAFSYEAQERTFKLGLRGSSNTTN